MLTPVENTFSSWKADLKNPLSEPSAQEGMRRGNDSVGSLRRQQRLKYGETALHTVTQPMCEHWQQHCSTFFPKCINEEDIFT